MTGGPHYGYRLWPLRTARDVLLFHWSPTSRREAILRDGLEPGHEPPLGGHTTVSEGRPVRPYVAALLVRLFAR